MDLNLYWDVLDMELKLFHNLNFSPQKEPKSYRDEKAELFSMVKPSISTRGIHPKTKESIAHKTHTQSDTMLSYLPNSKPIYTSIEISL